jgi:hypothetical protein
MKERKEMNLKAITNLALLCKLCATEEKFELIECEDEYVFKEGILYLVIGDSLIYAFHRLNDMAQYDIKELK